MSTIALNKVFTIQKGNRKMRWKIVKHPVFENVFAIVRDYNELYSGECTKADQEHLGYGGKTLQEAYESAFTHT